MVHPIIFMHGSGARAHIWRQQLEGPVRIIPHAGHYVFRKQPKAVNGVVELI